MLWVQLCAVFSLYYHHVHGLVEFPAEDDLDARVNLPGLPAMSVADDRRAVVPAAVQPDMYALQAMSPPPPPLIPVGPLVELEEEDSAVRGDMLKARRATVSGGWTSRRHAPW